MYTLRKAIFLTFWKQLTTQSNKKPFKYWKPYQWPHKPAYYRLRWERVSSRRYTGFPTPRWIPLAVWLHTALSVCEFRHHIPCCKFPMKKHATFWGENLSQIKRHQIVIHIMFWTLTTMISVHFIPKWV